MEKIYLQDLEELKQVADSIPNTRAGAAAKVNALVVMNMQYEKIMLDRNLPNHPYTLVKGYVRDAISALRNWKEISFIEDSKSENVDRANMTMEAGHEELFEKLWVKYSPAEFEKYIQRYTHRLQVNDLANGWLKGKSCIDFGCGNGNFAHALLRAGAEFVCGIDFGKGSIDFANKVRDAMGVPASKMEFVHSTVYDVPRASDSFDFAIQNGVFHHLDNENAAIKEAHRVLKKGGWFWYYTDGEGGISYDLWDQSVRILSTVSQKFTLDHLDYMGIETGKKAHISDGLNAVYRHTSYAEIKERLESLGFGNVKRIIGGFETDMDHDIIAKDRWGKEKFGEGDLRLLAQKL